jgi:hypothetical protein
MKLLALPILALFGMTALALPAVAHDKHKTPLVERTFRGEWSDYTDCSGEAITGSLTADHPECTYTLLPLIPDPNAPICSINKFGLHGGFLAEASGACSGQVEIVFNPTFPATDFPPGSASGTFNIIDPSHNSIVTTGTYLVLNSKATGEGFQSLLQLEGITCKPDDTACFSDNGG